MAQGFPFHPEATGPGKTGRVNVSEPPMMPRDPKPRRWVVQRGAGLAVVKRQAPVGRGPADRMDTAASGSRGHPPRSYLARVERGNPVGVRVELSPGRLTVRKAQFPSGNRMAQEANAGSRKAAGNRERRLVLHQFSRITGQIRALARTRKGADVGQVSLRRTY